MSSVLASGKNMHNIGRKYYIKNFIFPPVLAHRCNKQGAFGFHLKGPIHDSDLQSQPRFPTATSTKFPVYGLQQPQPPP